FYHKKSREIFADPLLIKTVCLLLLNFVVSIDTKSRAVIGGINIRIRRIRSKSSEVARKVPVVNHQRITCLGVFVKTFREQNMSPKEHWFTPELGEQLAFNFNVLHIFGICGLLQWWNFLIHGDLYRLAF